MSRKSSIRSIENNHNVYRGEKICMKIFWKSLREHAINIITFKKKKEYEESNENAKICYIWKETFDSKYVKDKKIS